MESQIKTTSYLKSLIKGKCLSLPKGTLKNIDLLSAFNDSTSDDVSSLITDEQDTTLVDEPSAIEDSLIASEELQSALMLYNDSFPPGQETVIENGMCIFLISFIKIWL